MQRTVAIDNIRRNAALTRRLNGRQTGPSGVIDWRGFAARRASPAFGTRWSASSLVASGSRFAVSRATPQHDGLELFAASPHREAHGEGAPQPRVRRETADDRADRPTTAAAPAPSNVPAPQFRISRRSAGSYDVTRTAPRPAATPARDARARDVAPPARPAGTNTTGDMVLRRSTSKSPDTADATVRRAPASDVSGRPGPHTPAANAPRSRGDVAASGNSQSHVLSRKAANPPAALTAPSRSPISRAHGRVSIARKHHPKGSAFPPRDTLLRRRTQPDGRAVVTNLSGETPRPVLNVAHAGPDGNAAAATPAASPGAGGAYRTADNFFATPLPAAETRAEPSVVGTGLQHRPPTILRRALATAPVRRVETRQRAEAPSAGETLMRKAALARAGEAGTGAGGAYRTAGDFFATPLPAAEMRAEPNVIGAGLQHRPTTILRRALAVAPVRRVEARQRAEAPSAREILMRKAAPARAGEPTEAQPLVMRQAASTTSGTPAAPPASPEAAASSPAPAAATQSPEIDLAQLAEQVSRIISRRLAVERERRGQWK